MPYEVNVSRNGRHFFAVAERSLIHKDIFLVVLNEIREKFLPSEGFLVTASYSENRSHEINVDAILKEHGIEVKH
jgi:hypothetical protein